MSESSSEDAFWTSYPKEIEAVGALTPEDFENIDRVLAMALSKEWDEAEFLNLHRALANVPGLQEGSGTTFLYTLLSTRDDDGTRQAKMREGFSAEVANHLVALRTRYSTWLRELGSIATEGPHDWDSVSVRPLVLYLPDGAEKEKVEIKWLLNDKSSLSMVTTPNGLLSLVSSLMTSVSSLPERHRTAIDAPMVRTYLQRAQEAQSLDAEGPPATGESDDAGS